MFSGVLAQYAPAPLLTPFIVLAVLCTCGLAAVWVIPAWETGRGAHPTYCPGLLRMAAGMGGALLRVTPIVAASWAVVGLYLAPGVELTATLLHTCDRALSLLVILVVQGCGGLAPMLVRGLNGRAASLSGCVLLVAARAEGDASIVSGFFAIAYIAVSMPIVVLGVVELWLGLQAAFSWFGLLVALFALAAGAIARSNQVGPLLLAARHAAPRATRSRAFPACHGVWGAQGRAAVPMQILPWMTVSDPVNMDDNQYT